MKKLDLSEILISDTKYYITDSGYAKALKKYGILTVDQILNEKKMKLVIDKFYKKANREELYGFIKFLKRFTGGI